MSSERLIGRCGRIADLADHSLGRLDWKRKLTSGSATIRSIRLVRVALEVDRADGENDSKRKIAQDSIPATASAAAYRSQNENVSARFEPGVETRAFAFDEHVDVASNRWRRIAKTVPHARPARLKSVHHVLDRLRLDLHDALGVGKERLQQGRQPDDGGRAHQAAVIVSTDEIAGKSRAMHSQVSPSSRLA